MPVVLLGVELSVLVIVLWCIACALLIVIIMRKIGDIFRSVPVVGGHIADAINSLAQGISYVLGKAERGVDAALGASWHALAWFMRAWWHQIEAQALGELHIAESLGKLIYAHSGLRTLVHYLERHLHGIEHGVKTLEREWHSIEAKVKRLEHAGSKGIDYTARQLAQKALDEYKGIDQLITQTIPNEISYAEGQTAALGRFIGAIPGVDYLTWAAGVVAAAIGADLWNLLRCSSLLNSAKKRGCGLWNGIEDVLGLLFDVLLFEAFCDLWAEATPIFQAILDPLVGFVATFADGACSHPPGSFTELSIAPVSVPPTLETIGSTP